MRIGILSDTHDNLPKIEKAVKFFNSKKVDMVLHAGDFVAPFAVDRLMKFSCPWQGVFGNNDGEKKGLAEKSGGRIAEPPLRLELDGKKVTVVHDRMGIDFDKESADLIVFGHSHEAEVLREGGRLFVNPGECSGWLSGSSSVAIADSRTMDARIFRI